jgi:hypothetical protein
VERPNRVGRKPFGMLTEGFPRLKMGLLVAALVFLSLAVQSLVALAFFGYCDENLRAGTARETVCRAAQDGGYLACIVLPPVSVLLAGLIAFEQRRLAILLWVFALAVVAGIAVPWTTALVAGYR